MNHPTKLLSLVILLTLAAPAILLNSCGVVEDREEGCPAVQTFYSNCENFANAGDIITGPEDGTLELAAGFSGGTVFYVPLHYTVTDADENPRSKVCVDFYTDGFFYADRYYTQPAPRSGLGSRITLRTDDRGVICVYWSTETLSASGVENVEGQTFVDAASGTAFDEFLIDWTVTANP